MIGKRSRAGWRKKNRLGDGTEQRRFQLGIWCAKLIGLNYEPVFNCTAAFARYLPDKQARSREGRVKRRASQWDHEFLWEYGICFTLEFGVEYVFARLCGLLLSITPVSGKKKLQKPYLKTFCGD